jgi:hypothetical protein
MNERVHVIPINDSAPHRDDGTPCWCQPREETGVVIHHSADGRELIEARSPFTDEEWAQLRRALTPDDP